MLLSTLMLTGGCLSPRITADPVYFPPPPAVPRAVHLKSFNSLNELVPAGGSWLDFFRGRGVGPHVGTPAGIAYADGHLYICDTRINAVHDWDLSTGRARRLGLTGEVVLAKPVAVAVDDRGTVYVADTGRAEVVAFGPDNAPPRRFKPPDHDAYRPSAVAVDGGVLYVADIDSHRVDKISTTDGGHLGTLGTLGSAPGTLYFPMGLATDAQRHVLVSDMMNARVQVFDGAGKVTRSMGRPGDRYGDMGKPRHLAVAPDGTVFIADSEFAHVHLFNDQGQLLMLLGGPEDRPGGTPMPVGVAVAAVLPESIAEWVPADFDADYFLFVADTIGAKRLSLFAVGTGR